MSDLLTAASWDTGAVAKQGPMMFVHPERRIDDDRLDHIGKESAINGPFLADLLAGFAAHERTGVSLFRSLEARTNNPAAKKKFASFLDDARAAVQTYDRLLTQLDVPLHYASPPARMTEAIDTRLLSAFLLTGDVDELTIELKGVEAVLLASTICLANTSLLQSVAEGLDDSDVVGLALVEAAAELEPAQVEHLEWAAEMQRELVVAQVKSGLVQKVGQAAEKMTGKLRDALGR